MEDRWHGNNLCFCRAREKVKSPGPATCIANWLARTLRLEEAVLFIIEQAHRTGALFRQPFQILWGHCGLIFASQTYREGFNSGKRKSTLPLEDTDIQVNQGCFCRGCLGKRTIQTGPRETEKEQCKMPLAFSHQADCPPSRLIPVHKQY